MQVDSASANNSILLDAVCSAYNCSNKIGETVQGISFHRVPASNELFNDPITSSELLYAIQRLDFKKSPGPDGIHGQFIVNLGSCATKRLLHIFNLSWKLGRLPRQWKTTIVVPIRKPNKDASCMGSYRPIALTCMTCKLMERIILRRITSHLMNRNLLPQEQYGFRKGHSTIDQILYFVQRESHRGSVLSPTLFSLYLTGIERVVSPCQIGIFADDIIVWDHNSDLTTLNDTLEKIQHFADEHKLAFNTTKSISSLFTTNRHLFNYQPKIFLKGQLLEFTKTPTYLGFTLDTEINCSKHINRLCEKGRKRLQLLKYISGRDLGSRCRHTQDHLYCSYKANP
ncbi:probable RNA-directed DNA polymerase from transposon BS [Caerostris extrusa]|uniref:Probable RNA-directed DNA polymerase from transposon BS n=1 Tax=Caerostris extrusa TaxID=172846 RepID=A0AAV4Q0R6_CAEEX|nr:probable RNA-directed DNA polymerase from transposon BS [Caerostris extrusa]